jgi:alkanesulfonate monooxygenase SsuD/methylene tetrahydromethanopterin reductase-like flavin-dependent oxidoreductase (luciferase family)
VAGPSAKNPTDVWTLLAGLARDTSRIRLGSMVSAATFRQPGAPAIAVTQIDEMSDGRVELGIGTGWYEREHDAFGIPLPPLKERFDRFEEQLSIITGLWSATSAVSFAGEHYRLVDCPPLTPVQQPAPPIIVGGRGARRTPEIAARFASEFNVQFAPPGETKELFARVDEAVDRLGGTRPRLRHSVCLNAGAGRTPLEIARRAEALRPPGARDSDPGAFGSADEMVDFLGQYAALGTDVVYLRAADFADLDHLELIAAEVMPQLA